MSFSFTSPSLNRSKASPSNKDNKKEKSKCQIFYDCNLHILPPEAKSPNTLTLDLSGNILSHEAIHDLSKNLVSLNLNNNPLGTPHLPTLNNLRSLSMDYCNLSTFSGFPSFPNLRFLSLQGNNFKNFEHFPILLRLESIDFSDNIVKLDPILTITAIGSIWIKNLNGKTIQESQLKFAFSLSPLVGIALRQGLSPTPYKSSSEALDASRTFLTKSLSDYLKSKSLPIPKPLRLQIISNEENYALLCPISSNSIKWYSATQTSLNADWLDITNIISRSQRKEFLRKQTEKNTKGFDYNNILPITNLLQMHTVKCDIVLDNKTYSLYTDYPIGYKENELILPFPFNPTIAGLPYEGSMIILIPLPVPCNVSWVCGDRQIADGVTSITLTDNEVGHSVACILSPYCNAYHSLTFSSIYTETEPIEPIIPTVSGIEFPELIAEGQPIEFKHEIYPSFSKEGDSVVIIQRSKNPSGPWINICNLDHNNLMYTPSENDIDFYLRISYTPISSSNIPGETSIFNSSSRVLAPIPKFDNPQISGNSIASFPLVFTGKYVGGTQGESLFKWYISRDPFPLIGDGTIVDQSKLSSEKLKKMLIKEGIYHLDSNLDELPYVLNTTAKMIGSYIAIEAIPIRSDEIVGESIMVSIPRPLVKAQTENQFSESLPKGIHSGETITFQSQTEWLIDDNTQPDGFSVISTGVSFTPSIDQIHHILLARNERGEAILGEIQKPEKSLDSITMNLDGDSFSEGSILYIEPQLTNAVPEELNIIWVRFKNEWERVVALDSLNYTIQSSDVGYQIYAKIQLPMSSSPPLFTDRTKTIQPKATSNPTIEGDFIEGSILSVSSLPNDASIEWFRSDPKNAYISFSTSQTVKLTIAEIYRYIQARISFHGRSFVISNSNIVQPAFPSATITFPNDGSALEGSEIVPQVDYIGGIQGSSKYNWFRSVNGSMIPIAETPNYIPTPDDVGFPLILKFTPIRNDSVEGITISAETQPIIGLKPQVSNVKILQNSSGNLEISGKYSGGIEGESYYVWYQITKQRTRKILVKTVEKSIPFQKYLKMNVIAEYFPIRSDGIAGKPIMASNSIVVIAPPILESLEVEAEESCPCPGHFLIARAVANDGEIIYEWFKKSSQGEEKVGNKSQYMIKSGDCKIEVRVTAVNKKRGLRSTEMSREIEVEEMEEKQEIFENQIVYNLGDVISSKIGEVHWQRWCASDWVDIRIADKYELSFNDIGTKIRAIEGDNMKETDVIKGGQVLSMANAIVRARAFKFVAMSIPGNSEWSADMNRSMLQLRSRAGNEKVANWKDVKMIVLDDKPNEITIWMGQMTKFQLIPYLPQNFHSTSKIEKKQVRNFVALVINGFMK